MTKRGVNLGCGNIIMPRERPDHQETLPEELFTDAGIQWDNVDWNKAEGVTHVENLFAYPWDLDDNAYDFAICSHIAEHIPHHITWNGRAWGDLSTAKIASDIIKIYETDGATRLKQQLQNATKKVYQRIVQFSLDVLIFALGGLVINNHPDYQDGWFAWFGELYRIMKPGGKVYVIMPYAWSLGAISDPTHTRYLTPTTFNYFNSSESFNYRQNQHWDVKIGGFRPHIEGLEQVQTELREVGQPVSQLVYTTSVQRGFSRINGIADFVVELEAIKDESPD